MNANTLLTPTKSISCSVSLKLRGLIFDPPVIVPVTQCSDWDLEGLPYRVQCVFHHLCLMTDGKSEKQDMSKRRNHNMGGENQSV